MRKLIITKPYGSEFNPRSFYQRNDSSNIFELLHPEIATTQYNIKNKKEPHKGVLRKGIVSGNNCYCKEKKIKPKILSRPNSCIDMSKQIDEECYSLDKGSKCNPCKCDLSRKLILEKVPLYKTKSKFLTKLQEEKSYFSTLHPNEDSTDRYGFNPCSNEEYLNSSDFFSDKINLEAEIEKPQRFKRNFNDEGSDNKKYKTRSIGVQNPSPVKDSSPTSTSPIQRRSNSSAKKEADLTKNVNEFRKNHYFETHSTGRLLEDIPEHKCIHKFGLDDRFLPKPLNPDSYGKSRCVICEKPMPKSSKSSTISGQSQKGSLRSFGKFYQYGLVPRNIDIADEGCTVQILLKEKDFDVFNEVSKKIKPPQYTNSLALTQQKMSSRF